jgi:hypothetical protein
VIPYHFTTGTATPVLTQVGQYGLCGFSATSAEAANFFLKFWWAHNAGLPTIGTTAPDVTILVPTTGLVPELFVRSLQGGGALWVAATKLAADSDTTALTAGGDVITLFLE